MPLPPPFPLFAFSEICVFVACVCVAISHFPYFPDGRVRFDFALEMVDKLLNIALLTQLKKMLGPWGP